MTSLYKSLYIAVPLVWTMLAINIINGIWFDNSIVAFSTLGVTVVLTIWVIRNRKR